MGYYADGTEIGNLATTGTGGGPLGTVTVNGVQTLSPGWGGSTQSNYNPAMAVQPNYQAQLNQLKQAQLQASMAALDKQKNASLSNLSAERATIEPQYQKQKIAANVTAKQTARSFDEYMAQRGGGAARSGIAGQGALLNNVSYQGQKGALDQAEASAISDNARRVTGVQNAYESDVAGANAGAEATYLQNYITQMNQDRSFQQAQEQFNKTFGLQQNQFNYGQTRDSIADSRYADETQFNRSQVQWERQFKEQGYTDDQAFRMAQLAMQQQEMQANNQYRSASLAASQTKALTPKAPTIAEINAKRDGLIGQVTSAIYDKIYGENSSSQAALETLSSNKGAILSDLTSVGMSAKDALEFYQSMYTDLNKTINPNY